MVINSQSKKPKSLLQYFLLSSLGIFGLQTLIITLVVTVGYRFHIEDHKERISNSISKIDNTIKEEIILQSIAKNQHGLDFIKLDLMSKSDIKNVFIGKKAQAKNWMREQGYFTDCLSEAGTNGCISSNGERMIGIVSIFSSAISETWYLIREKSISSKLNISNKLLSLFISSMVLIFLVNIIFILLIYRKLIFDNLNYLIQLVQRKNKNPKENKLNIKEFNEIALEIVDSRNKLNRLHQQELKDSIERQKNSAIANMTQMLAHDLRLPIQIFRKLVNADQPIKMWEMKDQLTISLRRIEMLVDGLRNQDLDMVITPKWSYLNIDLIGKELKAYIESRGKSFHINTNSLEKFHIDNTKLERAIINLTHNAIDAARSTVELSIKKNGTNLYIEITDDGDGIDTNLTSQIFKKGYTTKIQGSGLGLAFVADIIKGHGGTIEYKRKDGKTSFQAVIPDCTVISKEMINTNFTKPYDATSPPKSIAILLKINDIKQEASIRKFITDLGIDLIIVDVNHKGCIDIVLTDDLKIRLKHINKSQMSNFSMPENQVYIGIILRIRAVQQKQGVQHENLIQLPSS